MTERVEHLLAFHNEGNWGKTEDAQVRQRAARDAYLSLTSSEALELATAAISMIEKGDGSEDCLGCLASFSPGSLSPFHERLVQLRILRPGVIFHGAGPGIAHQLIRLCEQDDH